MFTKFFTKSGKRAVLPMLGIIAMLVLTFFMLFSGSVKAEGGDLNSITGYERVLIRPGDTLDSLSASYAVTNSHLSTAEYKSQIVRLNGLTSEYIKEGVYLLLPISK